MSVTFNLFNSLKYSCLNEEIAINNYMREWIWCVKEVRNNRKNLKSNDIRKFAIIRKDKFKKKNEILNVNKNKIEYNTLMDMDLDSE